ncbi:MAG: gamma-glutamyltransferase [Planctomycetia bacterium]|nr:gamma-glutamyltransferase [Planctomycetia bacterium]
MFDESILADDAVIGPGYDRPGRNAHQSRSVVIAKHGMVATDHPLATLAGLDVLRQGGNAADAAIAANAVNALVEPMSCGIGGDLFVIYYDAKTKKLYGLNASGRSPYTLTGEVFAKRGLKQIPTAGVLAWSVPGCVSGWEELRGRFGSMSFEQLLAPAITHAEEGFPVTEVVAAYWRAAERTLARHPDSAKTYLVDGRAPRAGDIFRNPYLARSYRAIAKDGAAGFYKGSIARQIAAASASLEGFMTEKDLADHTADWVEPVSTNYRGYDVWELPPNGQGIAALQMLNILEGYDLKSMGHNSAQHLHVFIEAKKLAFADRARFYADPAGQKLPIAELISKPYAETRRKLIDPGKAAEDVPHGDPKLAHGDTIYLCVVDKDRNCCSLIQSNYFGFGSGIVAGDTGFAMQNRGNLFSLDDDHPNRLEPHKRPFHTIIPAMVTKDDRPVFPFGVMGGDFQPQGHVQVLCNIIDFGMNVLDWERGTLNGATEPRKDGCALGY